MMAPWQTVRRIALALPESAEETGSGGNATWTVRGKPFAWERPLRRSDLEALGGSAPSGPILAVRTPDLEMKDALLRSDSAVFFTTPHFEGYAAVLIVLAQIQTATLRSVLLESWLARAPFENLFHGYPGAHTVAQGRDSHGNPVTLQPIHLMTPYDPAHRYHDWLTEYNHGGMNGFDNEILDYGKHAPPDFAYAYAMQSDVQPYWDMAANGTLSDATFADHRSQSFAGHEFPIAGASGPISSNLPHYYASENPRGGTGCSAPGPGSAVNIVTGYEDRTYMSCFTFATIADLLNAKGKTWAYYVPRSDRQDGVNGFAAIKGVRFGPQWKTNIISPETQLFTDVANGKLANVTYVIGQFVNSDHAGQNVPSSNGPAWVKMVENAIGESPFWKSTAIVFTYDDWGGWYDEVKPVTFNAFEAGFRIPFVVDSPYSRRGKVDHTTHYIGSVLHFIESTFGLGSLGTSDARSDDLSSMFDFNQAPLPYKRIVSGASTASLFDQATVRPAGLDRD